MKRQIKVYIQECSDAMLSGGTLKTYEDSLMSFYRWANGSGAPLQAKKITPGHLRAYLDSMSNLSTGTTALRTMVALQFLKASGNRNVDKVKFRIHAHRMNVDWLDEKQVRQLLITTENPTYLAMIAMLVTTGMRAGELASLREKDVTDRAIVVRGKGRKQRTIPTDVRTWRWVEPYLKARMKLGKSDCWLVHEAKGRVVPYEPHSITGILRKIGRKAGFHLSSHTLRRTFGRLTYKRGCPLVELKEIMGHCTTEMTIRYLGVGEMDIEAAMTKYAPDFAEEGGQN